MNRSWNVSNFWIVSRGILKDSICLRNDCCILKIVIREAGGGLGESPRLFHILKHLNSKESCPRADRSDPVSNEPAGGPIRAVRVERTWPRADRSDPCRKSLPQGRSERPLSKEHALKPIGATPVERTSLGATPVFLAWPRADRSDPCQKEICLKLLDRYSPILRLHYQINENLGLASQNPK